MRDWVWMVDRWKIQSFSKLAVEKPMAQLITLMGQRRVGMEVLNQDWDEGEDLPSIPQRLEPVAMTKIMGWMKVERRNVKPYVTTQVAALLSPS